MNKKIIELSDLISHKSIESSFHPIDRFFLEPYLSEILELDRNLFLIYNLETKSNLYTTYLMLSLPELWMDITIDDLIVIIESLTNILSFYGLLIFAYTFVEVDLIDLVMQLPSVGENVKRDIIGYLQNQYPNLFKNDSDLFFIEENIIGINGSDWAYIKQRLIVAEGIRPALTSPEELREYVDRLSRRWGSVSN